MLQHAHEEISSGGKPQIPQLEFGVTNFHINDRFALNKELACYTLSIELAIPIEYVFLQVKVLNLFC
jgi:hypothetical protein